MTLVLLQVIIQSISSTLHWVVLYVGIRALPGEQRRRGRWAIGSAIVFIAWLIGVVLLAGNGFFRFDVWPRGVPITLAATLAAGYLFLLSRTFREILATIPPVPRAFLIHSYSLIGLIRRTSPHHASTDVLHSGAAPATP